MSITGYSRTTSSKASHTSAVSFSTIFLALFDCRYVPLFLKTAVDEGFEKLQGHLLGEAALVEPQVRSDRDDRPSGIIHALSQEVLAEPPLLPFEHIPRGSEGGRLLVPVMAPAAPAVVEQNIHRLLEHPFFVPDDDLRGIEFLQPFEPVIPVDDPTGRDR